MFYLVVEGARRSGSGSGSGSVSVSGSYVLINATAQPARFVKLEIPSPLISEHYKDLFL